MKLFHRMIPLLGAHVVAFFLLACSDDGGSSKPAGPQANSSNAFSLAQAKARFAAITPSDYDKYNVGPYAVWIVAFDEQGRKIGEEQRHGDNTLNYYEYFEYDSQGKKVKSEQAYEVDSVDDYTVKDYVYNDDGSLDKIKKMLYNAGGKVGDGGQDAYIYSNNVTTIVHEFEKAGGGVTRFGDTTTLTYSGGNLVHKTLTSDDGSVGNETSYSYSGNRLTDVADLFAGFHYVYDADGNMVRREEDTSKDGFVNHVSTWAYETKDVSGDGIIDVVISYYTGYETFEKEAVGAQDTTIGSSTTASDNGLNWGTPGSCSTCGNMQGQVNKILLGY